MHFSLKLTSVALAVLGLAACGSSSKNGTEDTQPKPVNNVNPVQERAFSYKQGNSELSAPIAIKDLLASDKNSQTYGYHEGTKTYDKYVGEIVDTVDENGVTKTTKLTKDLNYSFVHQPYASYGMAYLDTNTIGEFIALDPTSGKVEQYEVAQLNEQGQPVYKTLESNAVYVGYYDQYANKYQFKEGVKGSATYKGDVVAYTTSKKYTNSKRPEGFTSKPALDGTITLTANFVENPDLATISGKVESKILGGTIELAPKSLMQHDYPDDIGGTKIIARQDKWTNNEQKASAKLGQYSGSYQYHFSGDKMQYVTGQIRLDTPTGANGAYTKNHPVDQINEYHAVFGAEREVK